MRILLQRTASTTLSATRRRSLATTATTSTYTATATTNDINKKKIPISWLDLRGSGLSVLERLLLEECLMRHDPEQKSWMIAGTHEPTKHRYLRPTKTSYLKSDAARNEDQYADQHEGPNHAAVIVMGIGGKPDKLLNIEQVVNDEVMVLKRFTGGGTVVLDADSIWTTMIGRPHHFTETEPFPRPIMEWSADAVFGPLFQQLQQLQQQQQQDQQQFQQEAPPSSSYAPQTQFIQMPSHVQLDSRKQPQQKQTMVLDVVKEACEDGDEKSGRTVQVVTLPLDDDSSDTNTIGSIPKFSLKENDYCLGHRKMGGNAQSIVKNGWLHHTSFLWDYDATNMLSYLKLPDKRPAYREDRKHDDFLCKLSQAYPDLQKSHFYTALLQVAEEQFDVQHVTVRQALQVVQDQKGGMQAWYEKGGRTRVLEEL